MQIDAMNLVVLLIFVFVVWSIVSQSIANPDRYLPSPLAVIYSSFDMLYKGLLPSYFGDTISRLVFGSLIGLQKQQALTLPL